MPASYRREVEYDRKRSSRVNPIDEAGVEMFDRACPGCGEANVDGVCVFCFDDTEPSIISLPDHSDWY